MTPALLLPAALAALGALLLPLLIHLARRSQRQPTVFAALRWLRSEARPQRRIRLEEILLLVLRLILIALLALWLARPVLTGEEAASRVLAVVPGADAGQALSLAEGMDSAHWLAPGFPDLEQPAPGGLAPVASLLRELDARLPGGATLTVAVPARLEGMDAQRPVLSRAVEWRVLGGTMPAAEPYTPPPPALQVRVAAEQDEALRYLRAAALSWYEDGEFPDEAFEVGSGQLPVAGGSHLVWLQAGEVPAAVTEWVEAGGVALLDTAAQVPMPEGTVPLWHDAGGEVLAEGGGLGRGRLVRFTRPLQPSDMPELLEPDFPLRLRGLLQGPAPAPASVAAGDHAPLTGASSYASAPRDLRPWLALLIAAVLLIERWVATSRRRERPA